MPTASPRIPPSSPVSVSGSLQSICSPALGAVHRLPPVNYIYNLVGLQILYRLGSVLVAILPAAMQKCVAKTHDALRLCGVLTTLTERWGCRSRPGWSRRKWLCVLQALSLTAVKPMCNDLAHCTALEWGSLCF